MSKKGYNTNGEFFLIPKSEEIWKSKRRWNDESIDEYYMRITKTLIKDSYKMTDDWNEEFYINKIFQFLKEHKNNLGWSI